MDRRQRAEIFGRKMENRAALLCRLMGYKLLARRVKTPVGELDIIARSGTCLIVIEVKARRQKKDYDNALEAINIDRIQQATLHYLSAQNLTLDTDMRFDAMIFVPRYSVLGVDFWYWPTHLKNLTL